MQQLTKTWERDFETAEKATNAFHFYEKNPAAVVRMDGTRVLVTLPRAWAAPMGWKEVA